MSGEEGENNPALSAAQTDEGTLVEKPKEPENQSSQEDHKADNAAVVPPDNQSEVTDKKPATESPPVDKAALKEQFEAFAKFGDKSADGKTIKLSQSDKWFKQAKVIQPKKVSTTDTGIAFRKISKNAPKLSFSDWNKYLDEISKTKSIEGNQIRNELINCGKPGFSRATKVANTSALDRLTDSSRYGGTHKNRFAADGKGLGKDGRVEASPRKFRDSPTPKK